MALAEKFRRATVNRHSREHYPDVTCMIASVGELAYPLGLGPRFCGFESRHSHFLDKSLSRVFNKGEILKKLLAAVAVLAMSLIPTVGANAQYGGVPTTRCNYRVNKLGGGYVYAYTFKNGYNAYCTGTIYRTLCTYCNPVPFKLYSQTNILM